MYYTASSLRAALEKTCKINEGLYCVGLEFLTCPLEDMFPAGDNELCGADPEKCDRGRRRVCKRTVHICKPGIAARTTLHPRYIAPNTVSDGFIEKEDSALGFAIAHGYISESDLEYISGVAELPKYTGKR